MRWMNFAFFYSLANSLTEGQRSRNDVDHLLTRQVLRSRSRGHDHFFRVVTPSLAKFGRSPFVTPVVSLSTALMEATPC